jgi:hypothetical protein
MFSRKRNDTMYVTTLRMGVPRASSVLYYGEDELIADDGGASLIISGKYIDGTRYVIVDQVMSFLYHKNGDNLNLLSKPYILDTRTFEAIENDKYTLPSPKDDPNVFEVEGGIENYITSLFNAQPQIMKIAKRG